MRIHPSELQLRCSNSRHDGGDAPARLIPHCRRYSYGGPFTAAAGTAQNTDHVVVRVKASSTAGGEGVSSATFNAAGRMATTVTTYQPASSITGLALQSTSGDDTGAGSARFVSPATSSTGCRNAQDGVSFTLNGALCDWHHRTLPARTTQLLRWAQYENARALYRDGTPGLDRAANGEDAVMSPLWFVVCDRVLVAHGSVAVRGGSSSSTADQRSAVHGEVRFNSTILFSHPSRRPRLRLPMWDGLHRQRDIPMDRRGRDP